MVGWCAYCDCSLPVGDCFLGTGALRVDNSRVDFCLALTVASRVIQRLR